MRRTYNSCFSLNNVPDRNYWNRLELEITSKNTTARVVHWTGRKVASASTKEWAIRQFLYNTTDAAALEVVAKVCLVSSLGI